MENGARNQTALQSLIRKLEKAQSEVRDKRLELAIAEAHILKLSEAALRLVQRMPRSDRADLKHRIVAVVRLLGPGGRRATVAYSSVLHLLMNRLEEDWSVAEAHRELAANGISCDFQQVQNVFQYLVRKQRIERVSRGRFRLAERSYKRANKRERRSR